MNRSLVLTIAVLAGVIVSSLVDAQEVQETSINYSGPLYAWSAYVSLTHVAVPVYAGEIIANRPFQQVANATPRAGRTTIQNSTTVAPQPTSGFTPSVNLPIVPSPGGC